MTRDQVAELKRCEPLVRQGEVDSVHRMRVAVRRLRSAYLDDGIRTEMKWLAGALGEPRDVEVLQERVGELVAAEDPDNLRAEAVGFIDRTLNLRLVAARGQLLDALDSRRYAALLEALDRVPPPTADGDHVRRDWRRLKRRVAAVAVAADEQEHENRLHQVRKAAKRMRYAAETLVPAAGADAKAFAEALKNLQGLLGAHHDAVITQVELRRLSHQAAAEGIDAFTFGVLCAREATRAKATSAGFVHAWDAVNRAELRRWFEC